MRADGRNFDELRECRITRDVMKHAGGSVIIEMGLTKVICTASLEEGVPAFLRNSGRGWLTAEYSMLPAATPVRNARESSRGRVGGRTHEIQRLIGRSLRAVTDLTRFGERTMYIDCDVLQADGGTRTASITGGFIALVDALRRCRKEKIIDSYAVSDYISAISAGVVNGTAMLDLDYREDSRADVDANFIMTKQGHIIEVQVTAESKPFDKKLLDSMLLLADKGISRLTGIQEAILKGL
ncbi:MAG: ribonuclease PH [Deltaproteobacteria bacterium]|nr:ribonuclease PH [Deltaproteobacteria bacterium]